MGAVSKAEMEMSNRGVAFRMYVAGTDLTRHSAQRPVDAVIGRDVRRVVESGVPAGGSASDGMSGSASSCSSH